MTSVLGKRAAPQTDTAYNTGPRKGRRTGIHSLPRGRPYSPEELAKIHQIIQKYEKKQSLTDPQRFHKILEEADRALQTRPTKGLETKIRKLLKDRRQAQIAQIDSLVAEFSRMKL